MNFMVWLIPITNSFSFDLIIFLIYAERKTGINI